MPLLDVWDAKHLPLWRIRKELPTSEQLSFTSLPITARFCWRDFAIINDSISITDLIPNHPFAECELFVWTLDAWM